MTDVTQTLGHSATTRFNAEYERLVVEDQEVKEKGDHVVEIDDKLFWAISIALSGIVLFSMLVSLIFLKYGGKSAIPYLNLNQIGLIGITLIVFYLALSLGTVRLDEWGGLTFFGKPVRFFDKPGLVFRPLGIFRLVTEPRGIQQNLFPGPPEKILRFNSENSGNEVYPEGTVRPIIVTTGSPTEEELKTLREMTKKGLPAETEVLFRQFTVDVSFFVQWRVADLFAFEKVIPGDSFEERRHSTIERLRSVAEAELKETFGELTPAIVIICWEEIGRRIALRLRKITRPWGIFIERAGLTEQNLSHKTHVEQARAIRAAFEQITITRAAEAEEAKRDLEGRGSAKAERSMLEARAIGLNKIAEKLEMEDKQLVLLAELAEKIAANSNYAIYGGRGGVQDMFSAISAIKGIPPATTN